MVIVKMRRPEQGSANEGDINWPKVMKAVKKVNHQGEWLIAEVSGGDRNRLKDISTRMDKIISYL